MADTRLCGVGMPQSTQLKEHRRTSSPGMTVFLIEVHQAEQKTAEYQLALSTRHLDSDEIEQRIKAFRRYVQRQILGGEFWDEPS